jgi:hypothetical protein
MPTRRVIIGFALMAALGAPGASLAADTSAKDFVTKIYDAYKGKDAPGTGTSDEDLLAVFEPSLAKLIIKDAEDADKKGETPRLDGDPFVAAQEWEIESFDITVRDGPRSRTSTSRPISRSISSSSQSAGASATSTGATAACAGC